MGSRPLLQRCIHDHVTSYCATACIVDVIGRRQIKRFIQAVASQFSEVPGPRSQGQLFNDDYTQPDLSACSAPADAADGEPVFWPDRVGQTFPADGFVSRAAGSRMLISMQIVQVCGDFIVLVIVFVLAVTDRIAGERERGRGTRTTRSTLLRLRP